MNMEWLRSQFGQDFEHIQADVRDGTSLVKAAKDVDVIVHLAAQVAVTTSVTEPRPDFEINALGTFNVLEAARASGRQPILIYASTNKVYGGMEDVTVLEEPTSYRYQDFPHGISEQQPLDFHSPYGCSKGSGDQYVRDYHRIYGLPSVVLRQSCIYGPRQFGIEDQGWVAWFVIAAVTGKPISIYGDGKQVRDVLFVDDLLDMYDCAIQQIDQAAGKVYNVGGGPANTISVWKEFGPRLEETVGHSIPVAWGDWRPGDQRIYVSDIRKAGQELGWQPKIGVNQGMQKLFDWVKANRELF
jgi:CDP-paratose 2-epimerase